MLAMCFTGLFIHGVLLPSMISEVIVPSVPMLAMCFAVLFIHGVLLLIQKRVIRIINNKNY